MGEKMRHYEKCIADLESELKKAKLAGTLSSKLGEDLELKTKEINDLSLKVLHIYLYLHF